MSCLKEQAILFSVKRVFLLFLIFIFSYLVYFSFATHFKERPLWQIDYFNSLAQSVVHGRVDIQNPAQTYDLLFYKNHWYTRFGPLSSVFLIPLQIIKARYIPIIYVSVFFASLTVVFFYLLLERVKKEFFPKSKHIFIFLTFILFAFGTEQFYVATSASSWFVDQTISSFFGLLGIYAIFKKERGFKDYFLSALFISATLLGRITVFLLIIIPIILWLDQNISKINRKKIIQFFLAFVIPILFFLSLLFLYNYLRFHNPFEYGYKYIHEAPSLAAIRNKNGVMSLKNIPQNLWYMIFETPTLRFFPKLKLLFGLNGISIFFVTPAFLFALVTIQFRKKFNPYIFSCWVAVLCIAISLLLYYSTGWEQFGYRYSLDFTVPLLLLVAFALNWKINFFYILSIPFSIFLFLLGITALW